MFAYYVNQIFIQICPHNSINGSRINRNLMFFTLIPANQKTFISYHTRKT